MFKRSQLFTRLSKSSETNAKICVILLFPDNQLEHGFDNLKFGLKQIWFRISFDRSLSFVAPIRLILFANRSSSLVLSIWIFFLVLPLHLLLERLCMLLFVCDRVSGVRSVLLWVTRVFRSSARQVTLWSYFSYPVFMH